jgi:hypothetical protein
LTLTTSFEITLELQAGTNHLFRIVSLLAAPNTEFKADHMHTLSVVLHGGKKKGAPDHSRRLVEACQKRLQDNGTPENVLDCRRAPLLLLETIAEQLENSSASQCRRVSP